MDKFHHDPFYDPFGKRSAQAYETQPSIESTPQDRLHVVGPVERHVRTIILLHGRDDTAAGFASALFESQASDERFLPELLPGCRWVFPTAELLQSARFEQKMSQWFDMHTTEDPHERENEQQTSLAAAVRFLTQVMEREVAAIGVQNVFLGGISQGCAVAIHALLHSDLELCGFIGFSSWLPLPQEVQRLYHSRHDALKTPVLLEHCLDDAVIRPELGRELRDTLASMGMTVSWHEYGTGRHWINEPEGIDDMVAFVKRVAFSRAIRGDQLTPTRTTLILC